MGIFCEINLFKPSDGVYQPGQSIVGIIKYAVDEPMEFEKIIISLKGSGYLALRVRKGNKQDVTYRTFENFVDIDHVIQDEKIEIPVGSYEIKFNLKIPYNLPSTTDVWKYMGAHTARCDIRYYIRIKFKRSAFFARNNHFRKQITILSGGTARLLKEPVMYGETKKLTHLFSNKSSIVDLKATIVNSIIPIGGKINVHFEVENNSSVVIKSVKIKLIENYKFKAVAYHEVQHEEYVPDTDTKTSSVKCGDIQNMPIEMTIPSDRHSLEGASIISRVYFVRIEAVLPIPHRNVVLDIPVQIGAIDEITDQNVLQGDEISYDDPPPSYWETMGETKKEDDFEEDEK